MKYLLIVVVVIIAISLFMRFSGKPAHMVYKKGEKIKSYTLLGDHGSYVHTEQLHGSWLILYFYPKDDTPGCTKEAQTFSFLLDEFTAANTKVFGINTDTPESHRKFKEKYDLKVTLLTDEEKIIAEDFAVNIIAGFCSRDTILINPEGRLEETFRGVNPAGHPAEILKYIKDHGKK
jgi:peroxiredoxin Q/BCP